MFLRDEFAKYPNALPGVLLYSHLVAPDVLELADQALLATYAYDGIDMESYSKVERREICRQIARSLNLGDRWMVETNAMRRSVTSYFPEAEHAHPVARLLDQERRLQFLQPKIFFETQRYLSVTYKPPRRKEERWFRFLAGEKATESFAEETAKNLKLFRETLSNLEAGLTSVLNIRRLTVKTIDGPDEEMEDNQILRYLRECIYGEDYPFPDPYVKFGINGLFRREFTPGYVPMLDERKIRVLAIDAFPNGSWPGMFRAVEHLGLPYRWNTRSILMDPLTSARVHEANFRVWKGSEKSTTAMVMKDETAKQSGDAIGMKMNAWNAETDAARGELHHGFFNAKMILMSDSVEELDEWTGAVKQAIQPTGFGLRVEKFNATDAWRGTLPGHAYSDARVFTVTTENVADGMPLSMPFAGFRQNPSPHMPPHTPALLLASGDGNTPYYLNQHTGNVTVDKDKRESEIIHATMFGPTRAGKSFFLAMLTLSWLTRYRDAQVFTFDKKWSMRNLCWALGGKYYPLGGNEAQIKLAPLRHLETPEDRAWAVQYLETLCRMANFPVDASELATLVSVVESLSHQPPHRRSLTDAIVQIQPDRREQEKALLDALNLYAGNTAMNGGLLDGTADFLSNEPFLDFEMEHLLHMDKRIQVAVLLYLFRCVEKRLTGRPTLIPIDEAWMVFDTPEFANMLRSWLKELSKLNAGVILCTQNLTDFFNKPIEPIVIEQAATKYYLPNQAAQYSAHEDYKRMGLNKQQILRIAKATAKQHYFIHTPLGFQQIELFPGEALRSFIGRNDADDLARISRLRESHPDTWQAEWLRECGLPEFASRLLETQKETAQVC